MKDRQRAREHTRHLKMRPSGERIRFALGRNRRRGLSAIVATLLMLAVTASLGVFAFIFATGGIGTLSGNFVNLITSSGNAVSEKFVVEQVDFCVTATCLPSCSGSCVLGADVYVRNVGTISSTLVAVYVVDQTTGTVTQFTTTALPITVSVGTVVDINLHQTGATFTPYHGHTYSFTIDSSLGNSIIFYARAT